MPFTSHQKEVDTVTDIFDTLESDLLELNPENKFEICLLGDFNSHTNNNSDSILIDENIEQTLHILSTSRAYLCVIAAKHFLIDPHGIVKASMCDLFIFFNCPVSRL